jgi:hypothetical protein
MEAHELIEKWKLNKGHLASKMDMPKGTFNNKLSQKHPTQFKQGEKIKLRDILIEMGNELVNIDPVDFKETVESLLK